MTSAPEWLEAWCEERSLRQDDPLVVALAHASFDDEAGVEALVTPEPSPRPTLPVDPF